ncbi:PorP/SprF family type IX secretion system membrane protein [Corallibacter sp.]|uniref:PorP/SprF family type IX secretion system membrane protein n=1 Tax=Corallibacter sp. TaxID=2038084 RepID=UPI003AB44153
MKSNYSFYIFFLFITCLVNAQDPIFTQSIFIQETLNPGYSGFEDNDRIYAGLIHRTQWPRLDLKINTQYLFLNKSIDQGPRLGYGLGINALRHHESFTNYSHTQINVNYAQRFNLNEGWVFRPGVEVGAGFKDFQFENLTLEDQININTGEISSSTVDPLAINNDNVFFIDISSGLVFEREERYGIAYWFGLSVKHLNRPNISFVQGENKKLDMFFSLNGNYRFPFLGDHSALISAVYMQQGNYNRLDLGSLFQVRQMLFGITAATNPARNSSNSHILTSINGFLGLEYNQFRFGLSYDYNTSKIGNTNGVYELSVTYLTRCRSCNIDRSRKR